MLTTVATFCLVKVPMTIGYYYIFKKVFPVIGGVAEGVVLGIKDAICKDTDKAEETEE